MTNFIFAQLDPRPAGREANEAIFASGPVFGVEVTVAALAQRCNVNLDHHGRGDTAETPAACEQALGCALPPAGAALATVRPDADSITAMAVLSARADGAVFDTDLVRQVGAFDRRGPAVATRDDRVIAIARVATDFKRPLAERVAWVRGLLAGNREQLDEVADLVAARDAEFAAARASSEVSLAANGRIACVTSTHRFATNLGYEHATVVVALNPTMPVDFRDVSKGTYTKFTVCRYDSHVPVDLESALAELQSLEDGWGGRGDIFGSPQGVSSQLTLEEVVAIVSRHLKVFYTWNCSTCCGGHNMPPGFDSCPECGGNWYN